MVDDVLPDSRLQRHKIGTKIVDWPLIGGGTARIEVEMVYCASCGHLYGWVPLENTTFACFLCDQCYSQYGDIEGTWVASDEEFNRNVVYEMDRRYGHTLTAEEILREIEGHTLGTALEKLMRESPYKVSR